MLYFVIDDQQKLTKPGVASGQETLFCPFCGLPVISFLDVKSNVTHAYHKGKTGCAPTAIDHFSYLFYKKFPSACLLPIPSDEHMVSSVHSEFPEHPGRYYSLPEQVVAFASTKVAVSSENLKQIHYETKSVQVFVFINNPINIIFIFNFNSEKINKFCIPEEIFYNSSVIEYRLPENIQPQNCDPSANIDQLISVLEPSWVRNEKLMREIQKINAERKLEVQKIAQTQSKNLLVLEREGIISIRR